MACRRLSQDSGHGWMGGKGRGMEATTTEPKVGGGNRLEARNMSTLAPKSSPCPLYPLFVFSCRRGLVRTNSTPLSLAEPLFTHQTIPALPSI
jgi:hypothetical protein